MSLTGIIFQLFAAPVLLAADHRPQDLLSSLLSSPFFFFHAKSRAAGKFPKAVLQSAGLCFVYS